MKRILLLCLTAVFMFATTSELWAQDRTVKGRITSSEDGSALPGVNVVLKGTTSGTVTDANGDYSLSVPPSGGFLVFTFIGLKSEEIEIGTRTSFDIQMTNDAQQLSEVVVTSLGVSQEKKSLGYSVQELSGSDMLKGRESNIVNSLSGKIAGVNITSSSGAVGASSRIVIRGASSFGNNQPLFVVDGVPISNSGFGGTTAGASNDFTGTNNEDVNRGNGAADLNPDDIESLTVLKGPNAAALYGSRGANGVILVTTKSGKKGSGLGVQFNSNVTFDTPLRLPTYQNEYGQGSAGKFAYVDGAGGGVNDGTDESWGPKLDAGLMIPQFNSPIVGGIRQSTPWVSHPNNVKNFFNVGSTVSNSVSVTGGTDKLGVRLSYTNQRQKGMVPNTDQDKNTIALNGNAQLTDKFTINATANYVKTHSKNLPGYGYSSQNVMEQFVWFGRQVDISALKNYSNPDGTQHSWNSNYHNNPYWLLGQNLNGVDRNRVFGNIRANYKITDWLSAFVRTGTDLYSNNNTSRVAVTDIGNPYGSYTEATNTFSEINTDFLLSFKKDLSEKISLSLNAGGNRMHQQSHVITGSADKLAVPGVYTLSNSRVPLVTTSNYKDKRINSLYFSGQVGFLNSLFVDFTGRNDWSSTLPQANNSYFYPSLSLSAVITDLAKIQSNFLSYAKVRGSVAKVGSDTDPYQLVNTLTFGDGWSSTTKLPNLTVPNNIPNGNLKPQFTNSTEFGAEFKFIQNRIKLEVTYYNTKTTNQIISVPVSASSGYLSKNINAGEISNKGIEIVLGGTLVKAATSGFQWDITANFARNRNRVVSLAPGVSSYVLATYWSTQIAAIPGQKFGSFFGYAYQRDPKGRIIHENGLPLTDPTPRVLGSFTPDWIGGINNEFSYKGVSLSALIDVKKGGSIYSMTSTWGRYAGVLEETLKGREGGIVGDGVKAVQVGDQTTYVPNDVVVTAEQYNHAAYVNTLTEPSIFDASFVKLRQVRLSYTLPNRFFQKLALRDVSIALVGRNLALLYAKVPHIDPETAFSNTNAQGIEFGQLPSARSIGFNISFKLQ